MSKSIALGQLLYKYYIEDDQLKVVEGVLDTRAGKKWIVYGNKDVPDERFPGYKNIDRVWVNGKLLYLTERDDALAKKLFTEYYVNAIKDLQKQIDEMGDRIAMVRKTNLGTVSTRRSKCFGEIKSNTLTEKPTYESAYRDNYDASEFVNPEQYVERKIVMLKQEMFIDLSDEDIRHMRGLTSRGAIDAAVRGMINKYWV